MARYGMSVDERIVTRKLNDIKRRIREARQESTVSKLLKQKEEVLDLKKYIRNLRK